ncbi:MAG: ABC transporter substrate-binding protein [Alphaproteobacteria bacterium RIFOXYD12_FULL_60_8]|nr:MAG: ABC transporter substrate-binding protein [Alphaproteobacteria bacterium RIFOXYD12_FULL_60_8]
MLLRRLMVMVCAGLVWMAASPLCAADTLAFRISTENTATHVQTLMVKRFAALLAERTQGRLDVEFHSAAELFRDQDVIKALNEGKVEMAVPGMWQLDRFEPNVGLFMLPSFYGREAATHYRIRDGKIGQEVNTRLESKINGKVLGRWIDLGHAHLYFSEHRVSRHEDLAGLRIRVAGGEANKARLVQFGAEPLIIPWPDFPAALAAGKVSGVLTSHETVVSAQLWTKGIRYGFEDREYFAQYIPVVAGAFWSRLPGDLQGILAATWEETVDAARREAALAQDKARQTLLDNGVEIVVPTSQAIAAWREKLISQQSALAARMSLDEALLSAALQELETSP